MESLYPLLIQLVKTLRLYISLLLFIWVVIRGTADLLGTILPFYFRNHCAILLPSFLVGPRTWKMNWAWFGNLAAPSIA